jgi:hypothetical protein
MISWCSGEAFSTACGTLTNPWSRFVYISHDFKLNFNCFYDYFQEKLCEDISNLIHSYPNDKDAFQFVTGFCATFKFEWPNIDGFRIGKYEMVRLFSISLGVQISNLMISQLARRVFRQALNRFAKDDWKLISSFGEVLWNNILKPSKQIDESLMSFN